MKAVILAAGLGTRLRPLTNNKPKVMVIIGGKPLLYHHIELLKRHGVFKIWISLHYCPETIKKYFQDGSKFGVRINYSYEPKLLGTAGALKNPNSGIKDDLKKSDFLVIYGDNLTNFNYTKLLKFHKNKKALITIGVYYSNEPWNKGVVEVDQQGRILSFREKPPREEIKSNLVNSGIYYCQNKILEYIPEGFSDFGFDIFPKLLSLKQKIYALPQKFYIEDIGTLPKLKKARRDFKKIVV